jgi:D-3-phosphoglycerate dehydrogenase
MRVLVADKIAAAGVDRLRHGGLDVDVLAGLPPAELIERIPDYDALVVRSETQVTAAVLEAGKRLKIVARAGVGVDNIDVPTATRCGVIVVNSPEGNTMAAAEHSIALLLALSRRIPAAAASLKRGEWKRSQFVGSEVYNKTLGVVGFGKIGREVAKRALGLGMRVLAHDGFVPADVMRREGAEQVDLADLFRQSDYITVHTPLTPQTRGLINDAAFAQMKDGVRLINVARGGIIDEAALVRALDAGRVAGAAIDVFEQEPPPTDSPLVMHPLVVATPHLGASTEEAQVNVALDVVDQILAVLAGAPPRAAVNMPALSADVYARIEPFLELGRKIGKLQAQLADSPIEEVTVRYSGDLLNLDVQPVTRGVLIGLLQPAVESVNFVNAPLLAEQRGIRVTESKSAGEDDYPNYLSVEVLEADRGRHTIGGTVLGRREQRIRMIDQFHIDLEPEGFMLFARHTDRPGIIGKVGTLLGEAGINIAGMYVGREEAGKRAVMALTVDERVPDPLLARIKEAIGADAVRMVEL